MNITTPQEPAPALSYNDPRSEFNIARRKAGKLTERDEAGRLYPGSCLTGAGRLPGPTITVLARRHTTDAIACLAGVMDDARAPHAARVTAAVALLDRAWGKSPVSVDLNARSNFTDFLHDVGIGAQYELDHLDAAEAVDSNE